jgi:quinol monooxygenase YgiN
MVTLTAIIRCYSGSEARVRQALLDVARYATDKEPGTLGYFVTEAAEGGVFVTHERYADQHALEVHNEGDGAKQFFSVTESHLAAVEVVTGPEIFPETQ